MEETFDFETSFGRILGVAQTAIFRHLSKHMKEAQLPITPEQFSVLSFLWRRDGLHQSELAVCTNRNRANVTRIIDILEREHIVERRDDAHDRRVFRIYLTPKGHAIKAEAAQCAKQTIEEALAGLTAAEIATCTKVLLQLTANLS